eukprot:Trichotokara_eunicae@DN3331_c0_g1_i1.p1
MCDHIRIFVLNCVSVILFGAIWVEGECPNTFGLEQDTHLIECASFSSYWPTPICSFAVRLADETQYSVCEYEHYMTNWEIPENPSYRKCDSSQKDRNDFVCEKLNVNPLTKFTIYYLDYRMISRHFFAPNLELPDVGINDRRYIEN